MAAPTLVPLSYDEILLLAMALEAFADECRVASRTLGQSPVARRTAGQLAIQIADAEAMIQKLNEARR